MPPTKLPPADEPLSMRQLEVLVVLVEHGSVTAAARHLGLSQSTVSEHLADLERRLGLRLVTRARSGVSVTPAGRRVLPHAREVLRAERNARMTARELVGLMTGSVAVGASTIPAGYVLPELLAELRRQHPGLRARVVTGDSLEVAAAVAEGVVEVGFTGAVPGRGLTAEPLIGDELVLVCAPTHALAARSRVTPQQLAGIEIVMREAGSGSRTALVEALHAVAPEVRLDVALEVGSTEAALAAVRAGLGVSFVSALAAAELLAGGRVVRVPVRGLRVRRGLYGVCATGSHRRQIPAFEIRARLPYGWVSADALRRRSRWLATGRGRRRP